MRPIVFASDAAYAMPLATAMRSVVEANQADWPMDFNVLSEGIPDAVQRNVQDSLPGGSASIRWLPFDGGRYRDFSTASYISKVTYARLQIPRVFPEASRVLYLDADLLVLGSLRALWEADLEGAVVAAVLDEGLDARLKRGDPELEMIPRVRDYFNAGVLLIDIDRWRKERISEEALEYLVRCPRSPYADQDALNVACDGRWKQLDRRWNFQDHYGTRFATVPVDQRPAIVHFVFDHKPWKPKSLSLNASFHDAFRSRTRFARTPSERLWDGLCGLWYRIRKRLPGRTSV